MFHLQAFWFCTLLLFMPLGIGTLLLPNRKIYAPEVYLSGLCTSFALYEVIGLVCSMVFETSMTFLTVIWTVPTILLALLGWGRWGKEYRKNLSTKQKPSFKKIEWILFLIVLLPMLIEVLRAVTGLVTNVDDSFYCTQSTTALYTNTINQYNPMIGVQTVNPRRGQYYIPLWPIYWASISQLTGIHPAIIMRTLLPIFLIPCAYAAAFLVFRELFDGNIKKSLTAILLLELSYETISCSDGMKQWWLMLCSWFGKSTAPNLICPFLVYLFLYMERAEPHKEQNRFWLLIGLTCIGGCLVAGSCFTMIPFLLGVLSIGHLLRTHDVVLCAKMFCCVVPCILLIVWSLSVPAY